MTNKNSKVVSCLTILSLFMFFGCGKQFLDEKPNSSIILPQTLDELQLLLQTSSVHGFTCKLPLLSSDELEYISFDIYQSIRYNTPKNAYIWSSDLYQGEVNSGDWNNSYASIFYANNVLLNLEKIPQDKKNLDQWNLVKGWALYCRAFAYFDLIKNYSPSYDSGKSNEILGVPIKLNPSIDEILPRSSQQATYDRVFQDLQSAIGLLSELPSLTKNQPSRISCYGLLARIYLSMGDYINAEKYADNTLQLSSVLIDYNSISVTNASPFANVENELLYHTVADQYYSTLIVGTANTSVNIPDELILQYDKDDLRLPIYFTRRTNGKYIRKRGYQKSGNFTSTGLALDEVYLIKSECAARRIDPQTSLKYLNDLLVKRYKRGTYINLTISDPQSLLSRILLERRKELIWRGLRWDDLKRLNRDGGNITLTRALNNQVYTLPPNDPRYVFPIPDNEINQSGIQQNQR